VLETARRKRREEDTEQKGKLDDLFLRTRAAAATLKEQADTEIQEQYATRKRLMKETNLALAKGQADLEAIVRQSEDTVQKAEEELNAVKSQAQREISRATDFKRDVQAMIEEAQSASSKAWLEVAHIRSGLRAQCCEQVDSLLQTVAAAQATLQDMCTEQQHLTRTLSRGLKLEAKCAMRHAVQMKELRKHLTRWSAGHEM
jgi:prophage DNA circulation protein